MPLTVTMQRRVDAWVRLLAHAPQQLDLHQVERIDVRIADVDRAADHRSAPRAARGAPMTSSTRGWRVPAGRAGRRRAAADRRARAAGRTRRQSGRRPWPAPSRSGRWPIGSAATRDTSPQSGRARRARRRGRAHPRRRARRPASAASASRRTARGWRAGRPRCVPPLRRAGRLPMFSSPISASGVEAWK